MTISSSQVVEIFAFFLKILFTYLREREEKEREHEQMGGQRAEGEADSSRSREPDAGLHPRTLRS